LRVVCPSSMFVGLRARALAGNMAREVAGKRSRALLLGAEVVFECARILGEIDLALAALGSA
jgi:hypothetical protein